MPQESTVEGIESAGNRLIAIALANHDQDGAHRIMLIQPEQPMAVLDMDLSPRQIDLQYQEGRLYMFAESISQRAEDSKWQYDLTVYKLQGNNLCRIRDVSFVAEEAIYRYNILWYYGILTGVDQTASIVRLLQIISCY